MSSVGQSHQAPVTGLQTSSPIAAMRPESALILDNFIPYSDRVALRPGSISHATELPGNVETLLPFSVGTGSKLFAFAGTGVFDVTSGGVVGASLFTTTGARWQGTQFATSAVDALVCVNGLDDMRQWYSGAWNTVVTVGAAPFSTNTFNLVCAYKQRLFFGIKGTLNFVYLPPGTISGGTAADFRLNQLFTRGGVLAGISTWSVDSGSGPDDHIIFFTTEGEAAVYRGTDPGDATKWSLVGVYYVGPPIGNRFTAKVGSDLWAVTRTGIISLTKVMRTGRVSAKDLVSYPIQPTYELAVRESASDFGWEILPYLPQGIVLLPHNVPATTGSQFALQTGSGAWSRFTGWPGLCFAEFGGQLFYGRANKVSRAMTSTSDEGAWIEGRLLTAYNYLNLRSRTKHIKMIRPVFSTDAAFEYQLGLPADFAQPSYTSFVGASNLSAAVWDTAVWDNAFWGGGVEIQQLWRTVSNRPGFCHATALRVRSKSASPALLSIDYLFERGSLV